MKSLKVPLHLDPHDIQNGKPDAVQACLELHVSAAELTKGRGFRTPSAKKDKFYPMTRVERLSYQLTNPGNSAP